MNIRLSPSGFALAFAFVSVITPLAQAQQSWRSVLYPENWHPGYEDAQGHFVHDFSYAGYHRGEKAIPNRSDKVLDVTKAPFNADKTGATDATAAIQMALDTAAQDSGGVVFLPAGIYKVAPAGGIQSTLYASPTGENKSALLVWGDNVVLRGAGADKTFLYNDSVLMRNKSVVTIAPKVAANWYSAKFPHVAITQDLLKPTTVVPVADCAGFSVGDLILLRSDISQRFIDEVGMTGIWTPGMNYPQGILYCRRVVAVNPSAKTITVDIPLRGFLHTADNARAVMLKTVHLITESGVEDLSIGMKQHPGGGLDDNSDNAKQGTTAYEIFRATAISVDSAENCWARRIASYCPPGNDPNVHLLSHGIKLFQCRNVTVEDCSFSFPQYRGEGGNGYMFTLYGNDCLLKNCTGKGGRHNFSFGEMSANGNVLLNVHAIDGRLPSDFHMFFSLANLIDNAICDGDCLQSIRRMSPAIQGVTTTQSVFWNTEGRRYPVAIGEYRNKPTRNAQVIVDSEQWGDGYVIGTRGPAPEVKVTNFSEGIGRGDGLVPKSLYLDQLKRRIGVQ